ncbi:hypothetical protein FAM09_10890 [Niastella caeni]|uniref:Fibronectin type III domain-containing protein n=1 Tax=Niastella caeni TaxID=2569763 RepID=A0A4S8HXZ5_9BACT|nr:hypothetical protein [Niastella caeni]THU40365.1 hypothetical protein FAM09_10890 [Niastella caeni]
MKAKYQKREDELAKIIQRVLENMENNAVFPNPPAALADLKKLLPELQDALVKAEGRDKKMVSIKNDKKAKALDLLQVVANYVTETAKGERTLILESGFDVTTDHSRGTEPPSIVTLEVELGQSGEATTRAKNVTGAKAYVHQYTKEPAGSNTEWIGIGSSSISHTFEGLTSDKRYWFRVVVIGFNKQKAYSPVVSRVIQ